MRYRYWLSFLEAASWSRVLKHTVSSMRQRDHVVSSHQTMSGRRSVYTIWEGKEYLSSRSAVIEVVLGRWAAIAWYKEDRTRSCLSL